MPERRMFTKKITESDAFLDMPSSAQMLYFHLSMNADDDGFVNNPRKIQRMCGASNNDFELLIHKSFVILFESGIIVIKHWKMHNYIQSDRYRPSDYVEEKSTLGLKSNKAYTTDESKMVTRCIQNASIGKDRLDKESIDKSKDNNISINTDTNDANNSKTKKTMGRSKNKDKGKEKCNYALSFEEVWKRYPRKINKGGAYKAYQARLNTGYSESELMQAVDNYSAECLELGTEQRYIKHGSTFFGNSTPFVDYLDKNYKWGDENGHTRRNEAADEKDEYADELYDALR